MKGGGHCLAIDTRCLDTVTQHTETTIMTMTTTEIIRGANKMESANRTEPVHYR